MIKNIHTLIKDIQDVVEQQEGWLTEANSQRFAEQLGRQLVQSSGQKDARAVLRLSQMGEKCPCQLWHSIHTPSLSEKLHAHTLIKFTYGHVIESMALEMARASGHEVTGEQDELSLLGVKGHRDCVIDGCIVDIKSTNSLSFKTIKAGNVAEDIFLSSYLAQLDGYVVASADDPLVRVKDRGYLLAVDKVLGHICIYEHRVRPDFIRQRVDDYKRIVAEKSPPACTCKSIPDGKSGNQRLDVKASYNPFKYLCNPRLRTFLYSSGPVFLTKVVRKPDVPEVDRDGKLVY